ncbi:MAG TPA: tetratricopeptide repeat protein, partial [Solimonas sp.]|nr:tetratricopeptide repeat protein [Solimonas sp.]
LREQGPSAPAFHLLGMIRAAAGNVADAAQCFRKALYLDPRHREALAHLAPLLDKQGDTGGARALRERLQRLPRETVK